MFTRTLFIDDPVPRNLKCVDLRFAETGFSDYTNCELEMMGESLKRFFLVCRAKAVYIQSKDGDCAVGWGSFSELRFIRSSSNIKHFGFV